MRRYSKLQINSVSIFQEKMTVIIMLIYTNINRLCKITSVTSDLNIKFLFRITLSPYYVC